VVGRAGRGEPAGVKTQFPGALLDESLQIAEN
jgi:hypothetical protein